MRMFWMLIIYSSPFGVLTAIVCRMSWKKYYVIGKAAASLSFLGILLYAAIVSNAIGQFWLMIPAFLCCFTGDIYMALYNRQRKKIYFLMGLTIFLSGHVFFVRWLCRMQPLLMRDFLIPIGAVALTLGLTSLKKMHTGRLRPFLLVYAFFVALLFSKSLRLGISEMTLPHGMIALGGCLFLISDLSILFLYFYKKRSVGVHLFNLATYYYGMFFLAASLLFF